MSSFDTDPLGATVVSTVALASRVDVRTVQVWLGHESLATTQKYLEPSKETAAQLDRMKLPF